ncbi:MAG: hypothetical protein L0312_21525, partial [Acidobacteria bacterium]|nr:hypothetical protein [Acidobacteriota bacterium]
ATLLVTTLLLVCLVGALFAHPHFDKTVTASVKGLELKLTYITLPYNAKHLEGIKEGFVFGCGRAKLTVAGEMTVGNTKLGAGAYFLRAKAKSADEWTLVLIPEALAGDPRNPDVSKGTALETKSFANQAVLHHLDLNLTGGHGPTDGKLVVSVAFGSRRIEGVITLPTA